MSIYVGNTKINPLGISKVYVGSTKVYEAVSYDPVFANNTWAQIKQACQSGNIPSTWAIGDVKYCTNPYCKIILVDKTEGRYVYASDNSYTHATFFIETLWYQPQLTGNQWTTGYANNKMHTQYEVDVYNQLNAANSDLYGLIDEIKIKGYNSSYSITDVTVRCFIPVETVTGGDLTTSYKTGVALGLYPYFDSNTKRTLTYSGQSSNWITRQTYKTGSGTSAKYYVTYIGTAGAASSFQSTATSATVLKQGIACCFSW